MSNVAINLEGVSKYYRLYDSSGQRLKEALNPFNKEYHTKHYALENLDLEIRRGDVLGVVGRNGCGKSTLLKVITRVLQPNSGKVTVNGKVTALLELGTGFNPEFTGIDNIRFYANVLGLSHSEIDEKLESIIDFADLGKYLYQPIKTYSSGMQARLGFAVAVHVDPDILILDEVLAVGDALFRRKCYAKMEEFFKAGKTIVYVSHDANSVNQLCNRAVLLYDGGIIMDGVPAEVTKQYEKILFSPAEEVSALVAHMSEGSQAVSKVIHKDAKLGNEPSSIGEAETESQSLKVSDLKDYYIDGYSPGSTVEYPSNGAQISNSKITTLEGRRVNVLVTGRSYFYEYEVDFESSFSGVSFGMKIKNLKGFDLSSGSGYLSNKLYKLSADIGVVKVKWRFKCNLLAGEYYTNAGVSTHIGGEVEYLSRIVDNLVFKVVTEPRSESLGIVDLEQTCVVIDGHGSKIE